jgi:signal transduction histidine kinase
LSIARGFIQALGGTIICREKPDGTSGACFIIELPMSMVKYRNATA